MRKGLIITILFFIVLKTKSQQELTVDSLDYVPVQNINWTDNLNQQLTGFLSSKDVVMLSEGDHGAGASQDAKAMIIKNLLETGDKYTLYLEASWINCDRIMQCLREKGDSGIKESESFIRTYEMYSWTKTGFWNYLTRKVIAGQLTIKGIDIDGVSPKIMRELFHEAISINELKKSINSEKDKLSNAEFFFEGEGWGLVSRITDKFYLSINSFVEEVLSHYKKEGNNYRIKQWALIQSLIYWMYKRGFALIGNKYSNVIETDKQTSLFHRVRDSIMANIFLEEYQKDKEQKIICSVSALHSVKNGDLIAGFENCCRDSTVKSMGEIIAAYLGSKVYNICFISGSGEFGVVVTEGQEKFKVNKPVSNSIEKALMKTNLPFVFVDLTQTAIKGKTFYMSILFDRYLNASWANNFSGVFFIRKMYPFNVFY